MNLFQNYIEKFYCALRSARNRKECIPQHNTFPKDHFNNLVDLTYRHNVIRTRFAFVLIANLTSTCRWNLGIYRQCFVSALQT